MKRIAIAAAAVAVSLASIGAGTATAATVTCGQHVSTSIRLDNSLRNCPGAGLVATASGITIDLNGHTIDGTSAVGEGGIEVFNQADVTVRNGTIREFYGGIFSGGAPRLRAYLVNFAGNFVGAYHVGGAGASFDRLTASGGTYGVYAFDGPIVRRTRTTSPAGISAFDGGVIEDNTVDASWYGIHAGGAPGAVVYFNEVRGGSTGIHVVDASGGRVDRNAVTGVAGDGITIDSGDAATVVRRNEATDNEGAGLRVSGPGVVVAENEAYRNGDWGIAGSDVVDGGENVSGGNGQAAQCIGVVCS